MTPAWRHLVIQVVAFARALADSGEHRDAAMELGDVVDQLHDDDRLAHAGAAEGADLAAFQERADQIDHLDAGGEHFRRGGLIDERGRRAMDRIVLFGGHRPALVHRLAGHVEDPPHHRHRRRASDRRTAVGDLVAALEPLRPGHRDGPNPAVAEVLLHLQRQLDRLALRPRTRRSARCRLPAGRRETPRPPPDRPLERLCRCSYGILTWLQLRLRATPPDRRQSPAAPS